MGLSNLITKIRSDYPAYREDFRLSLQTFLRFKATRLRRAWHQKHQATYLHQLSDHNFHKKILKSSPKNDRQFFFDPKTAAESITPFKDEIIKEADKICNHEFNLLGSGLTNLGPEINWHQDFKSGHIFSNDHHTLVSYTPGAGHDIKVPWELSRFQHLSALGQAYLLTKDSKYSQEFVDQITDWTKKNPLYFGPNWKCTMDVAIRAANWTLAWWFFKDSPEIDDNFRTRFYNSLHQHGKYILNNLEWGALTSNHYLANITGLVYLGSMFPEFKTAKKWLKRGLRGLKKEIKKQVYLDGVDFEASIAYHRLVLESFAYPAILCQLNQIKLSTKFWQRLEEMFEFTLYYTKPNHLAPMIGDCDDGRIHIMSKWSNWEKRDHSYLLNIATQLFDNQKFPPISKSPETALLTTNLEKTHSPAQSASNPPHLSSRSFNYGGIYIFRNNHLHCLVTASPNGQNGNGGHAHNDKLSFELNKDNCDFFVDPGSYIYTPDPTARNKFRSTKMHNTIRIDNQEINNFLPPHLFRLEENATAELEKWHLGSEKDELIINHNGYTRLTHALLHRRHFIFDKHLSTLTFTDIIDPRATTDVDQDSSTETPNPLHTLEWNFHLAPGVRIEQNENQFIIFHEKSDHYNATSRSDEKCLAQLTFTVPKNLHFSIEESEYSPSYGVKIPNKRLYAKTTLEIQKAQNFTFHIE